MKSRYSFVLVTLITMLMIACGGNTGTSSTNNQQPPPQASPTPTGDNATFTCAKNQQASWNILCTHAVNIPFDGTPNVNDHIQTTPEGITVRSTVEVPADALAAVDQAFDRVISDTAKVFPQWSSYRQPSENQLVLIDPDHFSVEADPGAGLMNVYYTVAGNQYEPVRAFVSSADTCYNCPGFFFPKQIPGIYLMAVVNQQSEIDPAHKDQQPWSHLRFFREAVHNSFEHVEECANSVSQVCLQFAIAGDVHPHWGDDMWNDPLPNEQTHTLNLISPPKVRASRCDLHGVCRPAKLPKSSATTADAKIVPSQKQKK